MLIIDEQMNISMTRGDCVDIQINIMDANGAPYDYSGDQQMTFSVRKEYAEPPVMDEPAPDLEITIPLNTGILSILMANTIGMDSGNYYYDIYLIKANGYVDTFIANKRFTLMPEAHGWS